MWGGFPKVIKKVFPNAKVIIDRFHVMKVVNKLEFRLTRERKGSQWLAQAP
jgi:transposase